MVRLLSEVDAKGLEIQSIAFPSDALRDRKLFNLTLRNCFFAPTSVELSTFTNCTFIDCHFGQLRIHQSSAFEGVKFEETAVDSVRLVDQEIEVWDPISVRVHLERCGIQFSQSEHAIAVEPAVSGKLDQELRDLEKLLRYFMRSTHISESVILMKLGSRARCFLDDVLPVLLDQGVLTEMENQGGNPQRRFKLGNTLESINAAMTAAHGSYSEFLKSL